MKAARLGAAALALGFAALSGAAGAMQAAAPAKGPPDPALACGVEIFGEADDRLFGESYAFARARTTDRDPPERMRVIGRLDSQLEVCRRRDRLGADEAQIVEVYAANQILLRGAARYLRGQGADPAKLDPLAERLSAADVADNPDEAFVGRHAASIIGAGIPSRLHRAAADYLVFARRNIMFRAMWARERSRTTPPAN